MVRRYFGVVALALLFSEAAIAAESAPNPDPWESFNRRIFAFNDKVDRYFLKPVAKGYRKLTPHFLDDGITNLLHNLSEPVTILNDALQGKMVQSVQDTGRFVVNSTVGLAGFFDVARHAHLPRHEEDFGQTLAKWGMPAGPYVVVPFMFGMTIRDGAGYGTEVLFQSELFERTLNMGWKESEAVLALRVIDTRADLIPLEDSMEVGDRYVLLRDAWFQHRAFLINDGVVEEDPFLDDDESVDGAMNEGAPAEPETSVPEGSAEPVAPETNMPAADGSGAVEEQAAPEEGGAGDEPPETGAPALPAIPEADTMAANVAR